MDSGYLAPGETFQDTYDVLRVLSSEDVIGIMDQLLCHEVRLRLLYIRSVDKSAVHVLTELLGGMAYGSSLVTVVVHLLVH